MAHIMEMTGAAAEVIIVVIVIIIIIKNVQLHCCTLLSMENIVKIYIVKCGAFTLTLLMSASVLICLSLRIPLDGNHLRNIHIYIQAYGTS